MVRYRVMGYSKLTLTLFFLAFLQEDCEVPDNRNTRFQ
jgi:hypothetical protein